MSSFVLTDARIEIDANVVSTDANQVSLSYEAETQDDTAFGDDTRSSAGGLKNWSAEVTFLQDFAAAGIDSIMFPLVGTTVTVKFRSTTAAIGGSNPEYTGSAVISSYSPFGGSVGDMATANVSMVPGGASPTLARNTS